MYQIQHEFTEGLELDAGKLCPGAYKYFGVLVKFPLNNPIALYSCFQRLYPHRIESRRQHYSLRRIASRLCGDRLLTIVLCYYPTTGCWCVYLPSG